MRFAMDERQFIRNFKAYNLGTIDLFLGAGASFSSGIATGGDLVWYFKREIYCTENEISQEKFKDLRSTTNRKILQDYFDAQPGYPERGGKDEYSFYFEKCISSREARKDFIDSQVARKTPSIGYLCLANLVIDSVVNNVWTTNFDELTEVAIHQLDSTYPFNVCSSANQNSFNDLNPSYSCIFKMHGDYRYDKLQNTSTELQRLESKIEKEFYARLLKKGLLVIGYSGSDESVMSAFERYVMNPDFLSKGLFWTTLKGYGVSDRVQKLIKTLNDAGKTSYIIEIESFDAFMFNIYTAIGNHNEIIDKQAEIREHNKKLQFNLPKALNFIKLNSFVADSYPKCNVFETDIKDWKTLKEYRGELVAALFDGHVYSFATVEQLSTNFKGHIKSHIQEEDVPQWILCKSDSIYSGMLYDLIEKALSSKGLARYRKRKFFDPQSKRIESGCLVYDAVDVSLEFINNRYYLLVNPTVHITNLDGSELEKFRYQFMINIKLSTVYNNQYDAMLKAWQNKLRTRGSLLFEYNGFSISFKLPAVSCGGSKNDENWEKLNALSSEEPALVFSKDDYRLSTINQLKGLVKYGPIDCSFAKVVTNRPSIRLGVLAPDKSIDKLLAHLNSLNSRQLNNSKDKFLPNYEGFTQIYKRALIIPDKATSGLCSVYNQEKVFNYIPADFVNFLKHEIDKFALKSSDFDVLVIYIPNSFKKFRTATLISPDFDLHDAIKLYATDKDITVQFIEEKSVSQQDKCKVLWGLSTALYAKAAMGVLWYPASINDNTAYIGVSYAVSKEKGICIGCSQLFDSTGTGMRMLLRKIESPKYMGKHSPYMGQEEARSLMSALREEYYHCNPTAKLDRIVIHKTTPFMKDEILGFVQAFEGIADIELVQIQEFNHWKGIKYNREFAQGVYNYPIDRGTVIPLTDESCLLWTHGAIQNSELGPGHYYKNSRGIPTPLVIRRFHGTSSGNELIKEILMLTKMNWNSGDSLYKVLPVTLDFAKVLSRMSKQNEAIYNKAYDFRYFM